MKYIALLRGINVSGKNLIKMDALKSSLEKLHFKNIKSYIQSGNIFFESEGKAVSELSNEIRQLILNDFSFEVPVVVIESSEFEEIVTSNPFANQENRDEKFMHLTFLNEQIDVTKTSLINEKLGENEELVFGKRLVYLYLPSGYGNTKLSNTFIENKLKNVATTRNWRTCNELLKMIH
jgi:uncharacterized protein (DUF1697 family)